MATDKCVKCGSYAFNLYKEDIDQGGLCDVHYWQYRAHRAEALAEQPAQDDPDLQDKDPELVEQPAQQEQESWEDLHNALQRIDTAAVGLPTFEVRHEGGLDAVTQNIVDAITALHVQPAQQSGLEMVDDEGENQAVRMFLALYGGQYGITAEQMRKHLKMAGFDGAWPEWASNHNGHLTKAGAQLWIRHLFSLEQPAQQRHISYACPQCHWSLEEQPAQQQEPVAWNVIDPFGKIVATEKDAIRGWARIQGYKPTVESLLGFQEQGWRVVPTFPPAQRKESK